MVINMGNVMISLDEDHEELLRKLAREKYGGKKGSLSEVVKEALEKMKEKDREDAIAEFKELLKKGIKGKYIMYKKRSEIYD